MPTPAPLAADNPFPATPTLGQPTHTATPTATPTLTAAPLPTPTSTPTLTPSPTPCATSGKVTTASFQSQLAGVSNYRVYFPPCYGLNGRSYPTLYMLPGNIHTDAIWDTLGLDEAAEQAILAGDIPPLLVVMADGGWLANNSSGGPGSYESLILNELIPQIEATTCAWPEAAGRAIGGLSRGGYWALEIAFRFPTRFASVGGHSAALIDSHAWPAVNPQYTGLSQDLGDLRIYFDIGEEDWLINNIRRLHIDMEAAGIAHDWVLNKGEHEETYWAAHVADYLAWYTLPWAGGEESYPLCQR